MIKRPRDKENTVGPAGRNLCSAEMFDPRNNDGDSSVFCLLCFHINKPLSKKAVHIEVETRRRSKNGDVARPTESFVALRTVGRDLKEV